MNSGSSTWTTDYKLVFVDGDQMGTNTEYRMPMTVDAGKIIDLSVELTAPVAIGTYKGYWKIKNPAAQSSDLAVAAFGANCGESGYPNSDHTANGDIYTDAGTDNDPYAYYCSVSGNFASGWDDCFSGLVIV